MPIIKYPGLVKFIIKSVENNLSLDQRYKEVKSRFNYKGTREQFRKYSNKTIWEFNQKSKSHKPKLIKSKVKKTSLPNRGGLDGFRKQYDNSIIVPQAIKEGISKYLVEVDGSPSYIEDSEFRALCNVGVGKWRSYADEYRHLQVKVGGKLFWGHPDIIDGMRKAVVR